MGVSYLINDLPGLQDVKRQSTSSADRPLCSLVAALSSYRRGNELRGELRDAPPGEVFGWFAQEFEWFDVPTQRSQMWASPSSLCCCSHRTINGLDLDPYQVKTVESMGVAGHVLSLGCGLGKTVTAISAALEYKSLWGHGRLWVACPRNAFGAWERYREYLEQAFDEFVIISIDSLHKAAGIRADLGGTIIFDEVHLLGSASSKRTKLAHSLRARFDCGIACTGTLLHGGIEKALSVLDLAVPGAACFASRWSAGAGFSCLVRKKVGPRSVQALEKPTGEKALRFTEYLSRATIALTKESESVREYLDLPPQHMHLLELAEPWKDLPDMVVEYVRAWMSDNPGEPMPHMQHVAHALARAGLAPKLEWIRWQLKDSEPTVIFAAYIESLDRIEEHLVEAQIPYVRIDGSVTGKARLAAVETFQAGEALVFLGQMDAACTSIELTTGWRSIAVDHSWKAANYDQALARTSRRGQAHECHHYDLVANPLQARIVLRVRQGMAFDASVAEWQAGKEALEELSCP